ncbi:MAG: hypothetical protein ACOC16_03145 [Nanoarchaeota archaeon]
MGKELVVLRRLELALFETSSASEKNKVYALLSQYGRKIFEEKLDMKSFYSNLDSKTLSVIENQNLEINPEDVSNGRDLASFLNQKLSLPQKGQRSYGRKMRKLKEQEYNIIRQYFKNE